MYFHPSMDIVKNVGPSHGDVLVCAGYGKNPVSIVLTGENRVLLADCGCADYLRQQITLSIVVVRAVGQTRVLKVNVEPNMVVSIVLSDHVVHNS